MVRLRELTSRNKTNGLTWEEYLRIRDLKELDIEICDYGHVNILNLGWEAWGNGFVKSMRESMFYVLVCVYQ
ncbi:MAG TPA: hypothetical protein VKR58_07315 [Aquella sp.]|nr:hypothetical protein [Aquella sp.]